MKRIILAALVGVLVISTADAEFQDGNQLITECGRGIPWSDGVCNGYIIGALDLFLSLQKTKSLSGKIGKVCLPNNVTKGQMVDVVKNYLIENPEKRHYPAAGLVVVAIREVFFCKK